MFIGHIKVYLGIDTLSPSVLPAGQHGTRSPARSKEEKLTGVLIILSIIALILTF